LRIYRIRLRMAESGTTRPSASALEFFRIFVAALETMDDDAPVRLDTTQGVARFTDARSGALLAELKIGDEDQQDAVMA
jgi:hypothetical protein